MTYPEDARTYASQGKKIECRQAMRRLFYSMNKVGNILLASYMAVFCCLPAVAKKESGYKMTQYSDYWGPQTCYVTGNGMWLTSPKLGLTMFLKAPNWKVICFNSKNKTYITCGHREWAQKFVGPMGDRSLKSDETRKTVEEWKVSLSKGIFPKVGSRITESITIGGTKDICGRQALQFFMVGSQQALFPPYAKNCEFWVIPNLKLDEGVIRTLSELGGIPPGIGLPLEVSRHMGKGKTLTQFKTSKIEPMMVDESIFKLPAGYKLADDEMALLTDETNTSKGELADVFGDELSGIDDLNSLGKSGAFSQPKPISSK